MKIIMNPDEDHHEHNNILMFVRDQNVCPDFKLKPVGPRTHGITPLDTLQRLYEPKDSINRDQGLSKTCTIAEHISKQLEDCFWLLQLKLIND